MQQIQRHTSEYSHSDLHVIVVLCYKVTNCATLTLRGVVVVVVVVVVVIAAAAAAAVAVARSYGGVGCFRSYGCCRWKSTARSCTWTPTQCYYGPSTITSSKYLQVIVICSELELHPLAPGYFFLKKYCTSRQEEEVGM